MLGFSFNGKHCKEYGVGMRSINRQLLPSVSDIYDDLPGRHGSHFIPGEFLDREIDIDCAFVGKSISDIRIKARQIAEWLHTKDRQALCFDDEPDIHYMAKVSDQIDFQNTVTMGLFSVTFLCEPFAYGELISTSSLTMNNPGTLETYPIFTVIFTAAADKFQITKGDKYIRVVKPFKRDDVLFIDNECKTITLNGENALMYFDGQFFSLRHGTNTMTATPGVEIFTVYTPAYL